MRIMSWNVNSIRVREARLLRLLERHQPDVLALQELKTEDKGFPFAALEAAGYHAIAHGQKTYNGVALLSRVPGTDVLRGLDDGVDDPQARLVSARFGDVRVVAVYVPNGSTMGSDKWAYKQQWYARLGAWLQRHASPETPLALCGDFNVAFDARDVHDEAAWADGVLYHPEARALLNGVTAWGLTDTFRQHVTEGGHYSWWDYRGGGFQRGHGLRIDYDFATAPLAARCTAVGIDRDERKVERLPKGVKERGEGDTRTAPSDHAPVWADFSDA